MSYRNQKPNSVRMLSQAETLNRTLVGVIRNGLFYITCAYGLTPLRWREFLLDRYRDLQTPILDNYGVPIDLDLDWLDCPEPVTANDNGNSVAMNDKALEHAVRTYDDNLRCYFRETCCEPVRRNSKPVVHEVNRHRFIAISSIVAASFPCISQHWPRHPIAGNDNGPVCTRKRK